MSQQSQPILKFIIFLTRNPQLTHEEFLTHWDAHAALLTSIDSFKPHLKRYVRSHAMRDQVPGLPPMSYDGAVELWFGDLAALGSVLGSEEYMQIVRPDEEKFIDLEHSQFLLATEEVVVA